MKNKLGISSIYFPHSSAQNWRLAAEAGISDAEVSIGARQPVVGRILDECESRYKDMTNGGLKVSSLHLPFNPGWDISALDRAERDMTLQNLKPLLDWAGGKEIGVAILHASSEPIDDDIRKAKLDISCHAVRELSEYAKDIGVRIAVENLPRDCMGNTANEMLMLTGNGEYAGICFDVNHLLIESHREFMHKVGQYVITTHISDYDRVDEQHWVVGDGCIDWKELYGLFIECGYSGRYLFEINEPANGSLFTLDELVRRFYFYTGSEGTDSSRFSA